MKRLDLKSLSLTLTVIGGLAMALNPTGARAQTTFSSQGTEFWLGVTPVGALEGLGAPGLSIAGDVATSGLVEIPGLGFSQAFSVTPGAVTSVALPSGALVFQNETVEDLGIHVTSDDPISVYVDVFFPQGTDSYLGLPVNTLDTDYLVLAYNARTSQGQFGVPDTTPLFNFASQYLLIATQDDTTVNVTPGAGDIDCPAMSVTLNAGQTWRHRSGCDRDNGDDLKDTDVTGTRIASDKPVAVIAGSEVTQIPSRDFIAANQIFEQITPLSTWGTSFLTAPFANRESDLFRILAAVDGTEVRIDGALVATLNAGEFHEQQLVNAAFIETTEPAAVAQYSNSATFDNPDGSGCAPGLPPSDGSPNETCADSSQMLVPPLEQYLSSYTFAPGSEDDGFVENFFNLTVPSSAVGNVLLDGVPISASEFSAIGTTGFSFAQVAVGQGSHTVNGPEPFGIFLYGYGVFDNYSHTGGFALERINDPDPPDEGGDPCEDAEPTSGCLVNGQPDQLCEGSFLNDIIAGTSGNDVILAKGGPDIVFAGDGNDLVCGGPGKDLIWLGNGDDTANGGPGGDYLYGEAGDDLLIDDSGVFSESGFPFGSFLLGDFDYLYGGNYENDRCLGDLFDLYLSCEQTENPAYLNFGVASPPSSSFNGFNGFGSFSR